MLALTLLTPPPVAHAQMAVIDLKAIAQAESQVQNQLSAINNQLVQIQRLESQLSNQALMLQKMETDVTGPILSIENQATQILQNAQGIGYGAQNVAQNFANLYPSTMPGASLQTTQASLATWRTNNTAAIQAALQAQNQIVQNQGTVTTQVQTAVAASQGASGQTGAIQAGNQTAGGSDQAAHRSAEPADHPIAGPAVARRPGPGVASDGPGRQPKVLDLHRAGQPRAEPGDPVMRRVLLLGAAAALAALAACSPPNSGIWARPRRRLLPRPSG